MTPGEIRAGVQRLFRLALHTRGTARRDADEELQSLLDARVEHLVARGRSPEAARAEALRRLGASVDATRSQLHRSAEHRENHMRIADHIDDFMQDLRLTVRGLLARPGFTAAIVLTLALGIGSATGVFSIVNAVLLRALPYPEPDRIVRIFETAPAAQGAGLQSIAIPTLDDWRRDLRLFDAIALYGPSSFDISGGDRPEQIQGAATSSALFDILGATPILGRTFTPDEERPGASLAVVLSHRLWARRFGSDPAIVGKSITLNRRLFIVAGVMPPGFAYPPYAELWASLATDDEFDARNARHMSALARLRTDVTFEAATAELLAEEQRLATVYPQNYTGRGARVIPLEERTVARVRPTLWLLGGAVCLVLLVACVNVANLLVARATSRRREIAVRTALGAGRGRIARHVLIEAMTLFVVAGVMGVGVAALIVRGVRALPFEVLPRVDAIQLDWAVLLFAFGITMFTGFLFGLIPALQASSSAPAESLLDGGRGSTGARRSGRARSLLIVTETALAAMLLVGAGLVMRSMQQLNKVDPGFPIENVLTFGLSHPSTGQTDRSVVESFFREVRTRIAALPGVRGVGLASRLPMSGADHSNSFRLVGDDASARAERSAQDRAVTPGFFAALGIQVSRGREFSDADGAGAAPVIIVNQSFARRYFPNGDVIGQRVTPTRAGNVSREIVGVVADTRQAGLDAPAEPEFYIPHAQDTWPFLDVAVRTEGDPIRMLKAVQTAVWSVDKDLPLSRVRTMEQMTADGGAQRRLMAVVLSAFALMAYLLAAIGLYGVIAFSVSQRTTEIGIRMALGARRGSIARIVVGRGVWLAAAGAVAGLVAAVPLTRWLRTLLFEITPTDPLTFVAVAVLVPAVAVAASLLPARRAMRIDPVLAMRAEQ